MGTSRSEMFLLQESIGTHGEHDHIDSVTVRTNDPSASGALDDVRFQWTAAIDRVGHGPRGNLAVKKK